MLFPGVMGGVGNSPSSIPRDVVGRGKEIPNKRSDWTGMNEDTGRLEHFIAMLDDEDPSKRWKAAESLGRFMDERAVDTLILALTDEDWRVRQKAAWALGKIGDPRALVPLRRSLMNEREGVKEIIEEALDEIKARGYHPVRSADDR